jgi:hypothetical protein
VNRDDQVVLDVDDGQLCVDGPDDVVDDVATALTADKEALALIVDAFGPVEVVSAGTPPVWPPRGGFVPAWRRVSATRPLIVLPSERVSGLVDPFAVEPPTAPCPTCAVTRTRSAAPEEIFDTGPWQTCSRCGGRRWRSTPEGDVCVACGPPSGREPVATTWVRAGGGWVCTRCHPPAPTDDTRTICEICGGKGRCRPDHDMQLRRFGERLLRRTRSAAKQETIRAALAALPAVEVSAPNVSRLSRIVQSGRPPRTTTTRLGKEVTGGTPQPDEDGPA